MRERYVVKPVDDTFIIVDTDSGGTAAVPTIDWVESDGITPSYVTHWEREEDAQVTADYRNALYKYQTEGDNVLADEYIDLDEPVNGFVEYPYGGRPVCFRCFVEWVANGEEVLNYRRFTGGKVGCVNECETRVVNWEYE